MDNRTRELKAKLLLITSMVVFGTIGLFVRNIDLPTALTSMVRGIVGALFLLLISALSHRRIAWKDIRRNRIKLGLAGGFIGINWILLFEAYRYTTIAGATLAYYLAPVIVILLSAAFFREKLTPLKIFCVGMALLGMVFVSGVLQMDALGGRDLTGILYGLGAAVFYAAVILVNKQLDSISGFDGTIVQLAVSALVLAPYVALTIDFGQLTVDSRSLIFLTIVAVIHTGLAYGMYFSSMKDLKAQTIAISSYIDPLVAVILSALILREEVSAMTLIGGGLILGSTLMSEVADYRSGRALKQKSGALKENPER